MKKLYKGINYSYLTGDRGGLLYALSKEEHGWYGAFFRACIKLDR